MLRTVNNWRKWRLKGRKTRLERLPKTSRQLCSFIVSIFELTPSLIWPFSILWLSIEGPENAIILENRILLSIIGNCCFFCHEIKRFISLAFQVQTLKLFSFIFFFRWYRLFQSTFFVNFIGLSGFATSSLAKLGLGGLVVASLFAGYPWNTEVTWTSFMATCLSLSPARWDSPDHAIFIA